jgi:hypothetical protein
VRVEVLKGNRSQVRLMQLRDARAPVQADPLQVGVEVEHRGECSEWAGSRGQGRMNDRGLPLTGCFGLWEGCCRRRTK